MLQASYSDGERLSDEELGRLEAALVEMRAHLVNCGRTFFLLFLDRRR